MSFVDERTAFEKRVKAGFTAVDVQFPGTPHTAVANQSYVKMQLLPGPIKRITLGPTATFREYGTLLFMIFTPANAGSNIALGFADQLSALFKEAIFSYGTSGRIRCYVPELDMRGNTSDGVWYQVNLVTSYERDATV